MISCQSQLPLREDPDLAQKKISSPTINTFKGLQFGWIKDLRKREVIVYNPNGKVFKTKSYLRKHCAYNPITTTDINLDTAFTSYEPSMKRDPIKAKELSKKELNSH